MLTATHDRCPAPKLHRGGKGEKLFKMRIFIFFWSACPARPARRYLLAQVEQKLLMFPMQVGCEGELAVCGPGQLRPEEEAGAARTDSGMIFAP